MAEEILIEETGPNGNVVAYVEDDGRLVYMYLRGADETDIGLRSVWVRNRLAAPAEVDVEGMKRGQPPPMPVRHCRHPAGAAGLVAGDLRLVWLPEGDGVALHEVGAVVQCCASIRRPAPALPPRRPGCRRARRRRRLWAGTPPREAAHGQRGPGRPAPGCPGDEMRAELEKQITPVAALAEESQRLIASRGRARRPGAAAAPHRQREGQRRAPDGRRGPEDAPRQRRGRPTSAVQVECFNPKAPVRRAPIRV